jgi:hypothetical protein
MRTILVAALVAVPLVLGAAACGGSSNDTSEQPSTAAQWRQQASVICRTAGRKLIRVRQPTRNSQIEEFIAAILPVWKGEVDDLRKLRPPPSLARDAANFATAISYLSAALLEIHIATELNDGVRRDKAFTKLRASEQGVRLQAQALLLPACARQRFPTG